MPSAEEVALFAHAACLGYSVVRIESIRQEIGVAIARHMINRVGNAVLQTAKFSLTRIPLSALQEILGPASTWEGGVASWAPKATTVAEVNQLISPLLAAASGYVCAGSSRALQTASESCVRVLATLMPTFEISLDKDRMLIEFQYVLSDGMGELHPPKDEDRNEIAPSPGLRLDLQRQIMADLLLMADGGVPLSAEYLRQLGREGQALEVEALTLNLFNNNNLALAGGKRRRADVFEVERIMQQRVRGRRSRNYLVRWAGYHPSWEQWRVAGESGDPVDTVGDVCNRQSHGNAGSVASPGPALAAAVDTLVTPSGKSRKSGKRTYSGLPTGPVPNTEGRCQNLACNLLRKELREKVREAELRAKRLEDNFSAKLAAEVRGQLRNYDAVLQAEIDDNASTRRNLKGTTNTNQHLYKATAQQHADLATMEAELKVLGEQNVVLTWELGATAKQAVVTARAAQLEVRIAQRKAAGATQTAETAVAKVRAAKATQEMAAAVARAKAVEALTTNAELETELEACQLVTGYADAAMEEAKQMCRLAAQREQRARDAALDARMQLSEDGRNLPPASRSEDDWSALTREAAKKASQREVAHLTSFLEGHK